MIYKELFSLVYLLRLTWVTNQKGGFSEAPDRFINEKNIGASSAISPNRAAHCPFGEPGLCCNNGDGAIMIPIIAIATRARIEWSGKSDLWFSGIEFSNFYAPVFLTEILVASGSRS